eukprot:NODE_7311_length_776_cov_37.562021_g7070_i0.p1 GENE.NODE_7311_length_776_cov_37.562021_g7070_i0~~NODE_7311_length_776_cov_37.562021_g7070_i0.p1  ORF type:complete len:201 (+),score=11.29 NODE_7311_length_776_cov_37.562021_g7070_i0:51-653(+)
MVDRQKGPIGSSGIAHVKQCRNTLDGTIPRYYPDGKSRDTHILRSSHVPKLESQKLVPPDPSWASKKNYDIITQLPVTPPTLPHLPAPFQRRSAPITPTLPPKAKARYTAPRPQSHFHAAAADASPASSCSGSPRSVTFNSTLSTTYRSLCADTHQGRESDVFIPISPRYQGHRPGFHSNSELYPFPFPSPRRERPTTTR